MKAKALLRTYLEDHHAGATAGAELARRAASANEGEPFGPELREIADEIEEDRRTLESLMESVGASPSKVKDVLAWSGEKAGRLKPNNRVLGYSPLSRVVELEGLVIGVTGKLALWDALRAAFGENVGGVGLAEMAARAEDQRTRLEALRRAAAAEALPRD